MKLGENRVPGFPSHTATDSSELIQVTGGLFQSPLGALGKHKVLFTSIIIPDLQEYVLCPGVVAPEA